MWKFTILKILKDIIHVPTKYTYTNKFLRVQNDLLEKCINVTVFFKDSSSVFKNII
jgi:hypothetical protein